MNNPEVTLRPLSQDDAPRLAELANNAEVSRNMRDAFAHPYTLKDAQGFIERVSSADPTTVFGIEADGVYVGNIGVHPAQDVYRKSAEVGYFIGRPYWNRGIASKALHLIVQFGFEQLGMKRLYACAFSYNPASARVLEKCGFQQEGISRMAVYKEGQFFDEWRYAILQEDEK